MKLGTELTAAEQRFVLAAFVHRFTGSHLPNWARKARPDGQKYPVQFKDDADWLANTRFVVTRTGKLDRRVNHCHSTPTWPLNPELRNGRQKLAIETEWPVEKGRL